MMQIVKRDGTLVKYDPEKIKVAIQKAKGEGKVNPSIFQGVLRVVGNRLRKFKKLTVEEVQDLVVSYLLDKGHMELAKSYIEYRAIRSHIRCIGVEGLIKRMGDIVTHGDDENSNKQYTLPSVVRDTIAGEYFRDNLFKVLPKDIAQAHRDKWLHWHDGDHDPKLSNCCIFNIEDMLERGTRVTNADIQKPNSVEVAMNVAMQIMASISASQYGGVSLPEFNEVFAKYAKINFKKHFKDYFEFLYTDVELPKEVDIDSGNEELERAYSKVFAKAKAKTAKNIYDACQLFEYQTNSILGSASQTPFSTITFSIPTSWESEEIVKSYLLVRMRGLGEKGIPAIFPKLSMIVVDGYNCNEQDRFFHLLQLAGKCIAKTYYPDILNYTKEEYDAGRYYARMGCRSRVNHEFEIDNKPVRMGRFNGGVVTSNLPHAALEALKLSPENSVDTFFNIMENTMYPLMKKAIVQRFEFVKNLKAKEAPILFQYGGISRLDPEDTIEELLKTDQASFSYGFLGIDDCVRILTNNEHNIATDSGKSLGLKIMSFVRAQADRIKEETGLPVSLYGTPAEAGIHTMFQRDLEIYGDIMPEWLKAREYYTNSFHFSSELPIEFFRKMEIESEFVPLANGGNISYVENSGRETNSEAIVELIQYSNKLGIQYFAINTITDVCYECGFTGEINYNTANAQYSCPHCGNTDGRSMKIQRRSCGYISNYNITHAKKGRMKEILFRWKHLGGPNATNVLKSK